MPLYTKSLDQRLAEDKDRKQAALLKMPVNQFRQDRAYNEELKDIESQEKEEGRQEKIASAADIMGKYQKERDAKSVYENTAGQTKPPVPFLEQALSRGRARSLKPANPELEGESIKFWDINQAGETGEFPIGHSPHSGPAKEPVNMGYVLDDLGGKALRKTKVDDALKRMEIREYEEGAEAAYNWQGPEKPEDPELAGVRLVPGELSMEEPMGMLDDLRAETQAGEFEDVGRDEESPPVKQMRDVQKKAAEGDPDAEKTRKELFEGKSKEETAMAKEELGNYYIGPGGYAINLDTVDASAERLANMSLLQHIPAHAKAQMLASWGYIDQEDVDKSPDDPKISVAEIQAASAIAVIRATSEGTLANTKEQTRSAEVIKTGQYKNNTDLSTMNNDLQTKLKKMDIDWEDLKQHSVEIMHLNDLDLDEWKTEKGFKLRKEEMKDVRDHFAKEMTFKYKNITNVNGFKSAQLAQQGATNLMNYNLKSDAQQKAWLVNQHDMTMSRVTSLYDAGNPEAAMMVYQTLDPNTPVNITGFWKKLAKTSTFANPEVEKEFEKIYGEGGAKKGINNYVNAKIKLRTKFNKTTLNDDGYTELDRWVKDNQENNNFTERLGPVWSEMSDEQQNEVAGGYPAWKSEMISKAINYQMGQGEFRGVYNAMESNKIKITSGRKGVPKVKTIQPLIDDDNLNESSVTKKVDQKKIKTKIEKANETMKGELARGNKNYTPKLGSAFRGPSSKIEALKLGKKEVTTGMLKFKRNKKFPMPLDELLKKPKALVKYLKNNIEYYKLLSPAAQFWVAQQAQNQKKL